MIFSIHCEHNGVFQDQISFIHFSPVFVSLGEERYCRLRKSSPIFCAQRRSVGQEGRHRCGVTVSSESLSLKTQCMVTVSSTITAHPDRDRSVKVLMGLDLFNQGAEANGCAERMVPLNCSGWAELILAIKDPPNPLSRTIRLWPRSFQRL